MSAQTYIVAARRWERGWELHIVDTDDEEIGVTQSRTLSGAERMVRDYLALDGLDADASLEIRPELDPATDQRVAAARATAREAEETQARAAAESRAIVRDLKASGLSGTDIAKVLHLSTQRISQLAGRGD
ncbi:hypothetical protein [Pseudonocardia sp. EC080619-01]|uniref:hypothetical protein n=1 Tax=Pseudonocardia sp. EC080619-01 TaxID=1096856 RepID=UPI0007614CF8|nr:hypothetical protein [Pseudonocardia sp. EC080619-01]